ncbi:aldo/keto reductase [Epithele typhae]|uniref:aldo/keto reductase n=1 Tax=Epithele typhae TaxID=378194 RepID=UPI0020083305|nr:aldo/keto reductase [Epithele typhae]KAH9935963.1 aldo/keto reductase [Epithele typhae]
MSPKTATIGSGASATTIGKIGHGLMMMTWRAEDRPLADEDAFEAIKAGVDAMPAGVKMLLNSGHFYGPNLGPANLQLLARFYAKYPEYADRTFISVKGGLKPGHMVPDSSAENLRAGVLDINVQLGGTKKMDLFECARVPPDVPLEDALATLIALKNEGHFQHIGMSECSAATLRKAHAITPISIVEIEVSLWSYEEETKKVIATAKELGIVVAAYSPLGRGFLTGTITSPADLSEKDMRRMLTRFQEAELAHNTALVDAAKALAARKGVTPAQLALAWVSSLGDHVVPIPGSSVKTRNLENLAAADITLTAAELTEIGQILASTPVQGGRYVDHLPAQVLNLWG